MTEVQIFIIVMYLLAAAGGSAFWQSLVSPALGATSRASFHLLLTAGVLSSFQIPVLNIQMKMVPAVCTFLGAIFSCTNYFRVIFTGGVGKNGSTIAVSSGPL